MCKASSEALHQHGLSPNGSFRLQDKDIRLNNAHTPLLPLPP
jgi:hypothetical protein